MRRGNLHLQHGYSLVELTIATAVMGVVVAGTTAFLRTAVVSSQAANAQMRAIEYMELMKEQIETNFIHHRQEEKLRRYFEAMPGCNYFDGDLKPQFNTLRLSDPPVGPCDKTLLTDEDPAGADEVTSRKFVIEQEDVEGGIIRMEYEARCSEQAPSGHPYREASIDWTSALTSLAGNGCGQPVVCDVASGRMLTIQRRVWFKWSDPQDASNDATVGDPDSSVCYPTNLFEAVGTTCQFRSEGHFRSMREKVLGMTFCAWADDPKRGDTLQTRLWSFYISPNDREKVSLLREDFSFTLPEQTLIVPEFGLIAPET